MQILTGAAMSPSALARYGWYDKIVGGRQGTRSLHFLGSMISIAFLTSLCS